MRAIVFYRKTADKAKEKSCCTYVTWELHNRIHLNFIIASAVPMATVWKPRYATQQWKCTHGRGVAWWQNINQKIRSEVSGLKCSPETEVKFGAF